MIGWLIGGLVVAVALMWLAWYCFRKALEASE